MRNHVKLPSGMTESRGSNDVKEYLSLLFSSTYRSIDLSFSSAFLCFGFPFRRLFVHSGKDGQQPLEVCFVFVTGNPSGKGDPLSQQFQPKPRSLIGLSGIRKTIAVARRMEYADWPSSPMKSGAHP